MRLTSVIEGFSHCNDSNFSRSLIESVMVPEVTAALNDWIGLNVPGILVGGLALSFYVKPRYTSDVDILFLNDNSIPKDIQGFTKIREHAFQHNETHVEVELLTPAFLNIPVGLVSAVINTSIESNGIKVGSPSGLIALKLQRGELQDQADIEQLVKTGNIDLEPYKEWITAKQMETFNTIVNI